MDSPSWQKRVIQLISKAYKGYVVQADISIFKLTRDKVMQHAIKEDMFKTSDITVKQLIEWENKGSDAMCRAYQLDNLPILLMHGTQDPVTDHRATQEFFQKCASRDKELVMIPHFLHNIHMEIDRERMVFSKIVRWLNKHVGKLEPPPTPSTSEASELRSSSLHDSDDDSIFHSSSVSSGMLRRGLPRESQSQGFGTIIAGKHRPFHRGKSKSYHEGLKYGSSGSGSGGGGDNDNLSKPSLDSVEDDIKDNEFGFGIHDTEWTLKSFKKMSETFKKKYTAGSLLDQHESLSDIEDSVALPRSVQRKLARRGGFQRVRDVKYHSTRTGMNNHDIEAEYWTIVEGANKPVSVLYGSDVDVTEVGGSSLRVDHSNWTASALPLLPDSMLSHINQTIPGVNSPMLYVGMMFSSFCWHTEDNHLFAINYIHAGEDKTWYGIPGSAAEKFERVMREALPDLFESTPNLLHLLITMLSPRILIENHVPIYRMQHEAGTYMVTFPRAYHAGFNHGVCNCWNISFSLSVCMSDCACVSVYYWIFIKS